MGGAYYNEIDPKAAAWLRELIKEGLIPDGEVDERSVAEVGDDEPLRYTQCHFFAGIGGWARSLRLAGWPDDRPVWTGSCPCQPFSCAGRGLGTDDPRHLWPQFRRLVAECRPPVVFGEQVASKAGRLWLSGIQADLEALGYAVGAADLCAAGIGAPHIRQRLWWVADSNADGSLDDEQSEEGRETEPTSKHSGAGGMAQPDGKREAQPHGEPDEPGGGVGAEDKPDGPRIHGFWADAAYIPCADGKARRIEPGISPLAYGVSGRVGLLRGYGNAIVPEVAAEFVRAYTEVKNESAG